LFPIPIPRLSNSALFVKSKPLGDVVGFLIIGAGAHASIFIIG